MLHRLRFPTLLSAVMAALVSGSYSAQETPSSVVSSGGELQSPESAVELDPEAPGTIQRIWRWSDAQLRGVFDIVLPDTQERGTWELEFQPRVWDLVDDDYVRVPFGVKYGFNRRTEGQLMLGSYFASPWGDESGAGIATVRGGFKRRWKLSPESLINGATGIEVTCPLADAPYDLNHGVNRGSLFIATSRRFTSTRQIEGILNLSYDLITPSSADGKIRDSQPQDDFFRISPGILRHRGRFIYGLSAAWAHTVDGPSENYFSLTPSVIVEIPSKYMFNTPGRWQLGLALEAKHYHDEYDLELRMRMRWFGSISRVYKDWRDNRRAEAMAAGSRIGGTSR
jgi:hypothetical protein